MKIKKKYLTEEKKQQILSNLSHILSHETHVVFGYAHGSFLSPEGFNDLDLAVFVDEDSFKAKENLFKYELQLAARTDLALPGNTIDLRLLNTAPLSFGYRVVNTGILLFSNDETKRIAFVTKTRSLFFDFEPHRRLLYQVLVLGKSYD